MINFLIVDKIIKNALIEDIPNEDITTNSIVSEDSISSVDLLCKEEGIIAGLEVFARVFHILGDVTVDLWKKDGDKVYPKEKIAELKGNTRNILKGDRFVKEIEHTDAKLLDTRKTTPNLKILEKYAVKIGGGHNHRFNLSDGVMLKDNHIGAAGGITNAVNLARKNSSFVRKIEVETETLDMVKEALEVKADIIMLDNMDLDTAKKAVSIIGNKAQIEFSGNVSLETIKSIAEIGVGFISVGALTHSSKILDLSMKNLKPLN